MSADGHLEEGDEQAFDRPDEIRPTRPTTDWAKVSVFDDEGALLDVEFVATAPVTKGVVSHVYRFRNDGSRDLAIVEVEPGCKTPLQRVVGGVKTIEGWMSGTGTLAITDASENEYRYEFRVPPFRPVPVQHGELMQWHADAARPLVFFEICVPPYEPGRFEDL